MTQQRTMIQVQNLSKDYGSNRAVSGISFEVHSGEVLGFLGPNGAGKSTTMKILTCFLAPSAGRVKVSGHDVIDESVQVRRQVGYLPEDTPLYQDMTTMEFLQFVSALRQVEAAQHKRRIREISEVCGLLEVMGQPVGELSKGYRQRVGLAQAMIHDPPILILDEPTSGLDPNQIAEIRELIKTIGTEKTVILSTHILPEVQATCGRVIIIHRGELVADGTTEELSSNERENRYRLLVGPESQAPDDAFSAQVKEKLGSINGVVSISDKDDEQGMIGLEVIGETDQDLRREIFTCVRDNGWLLLEMQRQALSLEDVFRRLTQES